ncbi:hypothetical protein ACRQ5D_05665 [Mucilaginibacter sp. P25]|uniref:hypothetical protein n=1 Tax=unclassified Mucilaginibacter TaxID=2617802 RepID=UPI003D675665
MLIGSLFLGKVHEVNGQWIETKFVVIGIPLFPTSSMLVTRSAWRSRNGFNIPLNHQSIIAGYARMFSVIIAFIAFIFFFSERDSTALLIGAIGLALWLYFYFVFGSADTAEAEERKKWATSPVCTSNRSGLAMMMPTGSMIASKKIQGRVWRGRLAQRSAAK